jgi:hypothetical protein
MNQYFIFTVDGMFPLPLPLIACQDRGCIRWYRIGRAVVIIGA